LAAKKVPKRVENVDLIEEPLLLPMSGVPLSLLLLRFLRQKKRIPQIARKEITPNTVPTTAPAAIFCPPLEWPSPV
jgi:hypothetical protein